MNNKTTKLTALLGSASLLTLSNAMTAQAQQTQIQTAQAGAPQQVAQAQTAQAAPGEVPEQVLITGSLIRGTAAVGVPVTNLAPQDFAQTGALTTGDLFRTIPAANVIPGPIALQSGANIERATRVNIRGLDTGDFTRSLLMVDGVRVPPQGNGVCEIDPGIIPALSQDRIDILVDGASATYGSDAVSGVINIILKRAYDGAVTQLRYTTGRGGKQTYLASQLWGRTWDGGDITLSYEWYDNVPTVNKGISKMTLDFRPWGLEDRTPIGSAIPGIISTGAPVQSATLGLGTAATAGTNCTNCFSIPAGAGVPFNPINGGLGPTAPFSGSTLNWTTFAASGAGGTNGARNEYNPYLNSWYDAAQQRNGGAITFDQRLTRTITAYGEGFYSNRRAEYLNPPVLSPASTNLLRVAVPTFNPYYPTGGAPTNLRVNYNLETELPSFTNAYEVADRYMFGVNIDLPGNWSAQAYFSETYDSSFNHVTNVVNVNAVSAALGWTIGATVGIGTGPGVATWTKPATVPYLNLFCDPRTVQCNSQTTLNYMTGIRSFNEKFWLNEKGIKADGPLFAVPAGDVKAAIGANYTTQTFYFNTFDNTGAPNLIAPSLVDSQHRQVWAVFTQVNVPVISDANALPGVRKLEIEGSWRHDQYSDVGGTSNPKAAFNWTVSDDWGITVRGSWGTSFGAPGWGILSELANNAIAGQNIPTIFPQTSSIVVTCDPGVGSGAYRLLHPTVGPAVPCGTASTPGATPGGLSQLGSSVPPVKAGWRQFVNTEGQVLHPEQSTNWGIGGEFAPTTFLRGLDVQATWYSIKITGVLRAFGNPTTSAFNDASRGFSYIIPTDLFGVDPACNNNLTPTTCPEFEQMVLAMLSNARNPVPAAALTNVLWLNDGGTFNKGWQKVTGIDWSASYDWDWGDLGAWNAGVTGTYYLHWYSQTTDDGEVTDLFHSTINSVNGVPQEGVTLVGGIGAYRMRYRARLGWSNGPWSVTGFMDYVSHYFHTQSAPPNVNFGCTAAGGDIGGGTFPCAISGYSNIQPALYTFDLSAGYDTGDTPENDYLKHIGIQLVIQNLTNRMPAFQYRISTGGGNPAAMDILKSAQGRTFSVIVTKTW